MVTIKIKKKIKHAIENKNIIPFFQQITNRNREIIKYEALVRIVEFDGGEKNILMPDDFLEISMQSGLYVDITKEMLRQSLTFFAARDEKVSVNFLPNDFFNPVIMDSLMSGIEMFDSPEKVVVEITEQEGVEDFDRLIIVVEKLRRLGVQIAIDDFGSGYANYAHILKIRPDYAEAHNSLGVAYMGLDNSREAANHFARAVQIRPDDAEIRGNLGAALNKQGRIKEARGHYQEAPRLNPDHAITHRNLGKILAVQGLTEEAVAHYTEALRIEPESAAINSELGDILINRSRFNEAAHHYKKALQINPDNAEIHNNLGVALANLGTIPEALEHFSKAVELKPDYKDAKRNLDAGLRLKAQLEQNNR